MRLEKRSPEIAASIRSKGGIECDRKSPLFAGDTLISKRRRRCSLGRAGTVPIRLRASLMDDQQASCRRRQTAACARGYESRAPEAPRRFSLPALGALGSPAAEYRSAGEAGLANAAARGALVPEEALVGDRRCVRDADRGNACECGRVAGVE